MILQKTPRRLLWWTEVILVAAVVAVLIIGAASTGFLLDRSTWEVRAEVPKGVPECRDGYVVAAVSTPGTNRHHTVCITGYIP